MNKTIFRKAALSGCMFLTVWSGMPLGAIEARAQYEAGSSSTGTGYNFTNMFSTFSTQQGGGNQVNTGGGSTGVGNISAEQFFNNPSSLLQNTSQLGQNITGLMQQGVNTSSITNVVSQMTGISPNTISSITSMISNVAGGQNVNASSFANLLNQVTGGQITGKLGEMLSTIKNLGNITNLSSITSLLSSSNLSSLLSGLNLGDLGKSLDTVLNSVLKLGDISKLLTGGGVKAITDAISKAFPDLAKALGASGLTEAVTKALTDIAGGKLTEALSQAASAASGGGGGGSCSPQGCTATNSCQKCHTDIPNHYGEVRAEITAEFSKHRTWFLTTYWKEHILPALMLMAEQLSVAGIAQVNMFGAMLDAKHQLETQRLFQTLQAEAHKDYQPSEGMCTFGTTVRSLAGSERRSNLAQTTFAARMMQRQTMSGDVLSIEGGSSDKRSRLATYLSTYCDQGDNGNGLGSLCKTAVPKAARRNIDIDYTRNIESRLTLDVDFLPPEGSTTRGAVKEDEQDVFALAANLYSHNIAPRMTPEDFAGEKGTIRQSYAEKYMDLRAIFAKRSVAQNSFAAITSMRASGAKESAPYTKALIKELGVKEDEEIKKLIGENPSYFAQMEILTKKIYQNPLFYTELYDKPANIQRKGAALQAIGLMQDRDLYNSLLRSEAVLSVLLETMLQREQEKATNALRGGGTTPASGGGGSTGASK